MSEGLHKLLLKCETVDQYFTWTTPELFSPSYLTFLHVKIMI